MSGEQGMRGVWRQEAGAATDTKETRFYLGGCVWYKESTVVQTDLCWRSSSATFQL